MSADKRKICACYNKQAVEKVGRGLARFAVFESGQGAHKALGEMSYG